MTIPSKTWFIQVVNRNILFSRFRFKFFHILFCDTMYDHCDVITYDTRSSARSRELKCYFVLWWCIHRNSNWDLEFLNLKPHEGRECLNAIHFEIRWIRCMDTEETTFWKVKIHPVLQSHLKFELSIVNSNEHWRIEGNELDLLWLVYVLIEVLHKSSLIFIM